MNPIRRLGLLFLITMTSVAASAENGASPGYIQNPAGFEIRRGVNLSHWLSQCFGWSPRDTFITERDIEYIRSIGYDHVRIPIDEIEMWSDDGTPNEKAFAYLTRSLEWSGKHGLRAIVDLHTVRAHHFNAENEGGKNTLFEDPRAQARFLDLWTQLCARLKHYPVSSVAYEIMNEPVADNPEDWNKLVAATVQTIRAIEPDRVLVIGSNRWQTAETFPLLRVPEGDRNIILSVHTYEPMQLTHYKAEWTPLKSYLGPVQYPGRTVKADDYAKFVDPSDATLVRMMGSSAAQEEWNKARLEQNLRPAIEKAKALNLQLYCGEFGCLPTVPRKDRLAYYSDIIAAFEENGIAWANWEYKADFGIIPYDTKAMKDLPADKELIGVLLKNAGK